MNEETVPYDVEPNNGAFIREKLYNTFLYRTTWTVIHFIKIKDLISEGVQSGKKLEELADICNQTNARVSSDCSK